MIGIPILPVVESYLPSGIIVTLMTDWIRGASMRVVPRSAENLFVQIVRIGIVNSMIAKWMNRIA
mgnify:CR=1 FL=1